MTNKKATSSNKILISAYACEPNRGSEPGVGWNFVTQIAQFHEVWLITRANNQKVIEKELTLHPQPNIHWIYFDLPPYLKFYKKGNRGVHLYYYLWQIGISSLAKKMDKQIKFNIIHHLTFVMYWMPTFIWRLKKPFVWGPVGGGEVPPQKFLPSLSFRGKIYEHARNIIQRLFEKDIFIRITAKNATIALATTEDTRKRLQKLKCKNIKVCSQVALTEIELNDLKEIRISKSTKCRFLSIGNLLHLKGFHLSLAAYLKFQSDFPNSEYYIIGKGPELEQLKKLVAGTQAENKVIFWGSIPRKEVFAAFGDSDVFIQPSLHDSGGFVSVEAMAAGLPVICLDLGGPALQVTEETGFKIPAVTPEQTIDDMAEAMLKLARDPELRKRMGAAGRKRVEEHFNWDKKGEFINQIYQEILANQ